MEFQGEMSRKERVALHEIQLRLAADKMEQVSDQLDEETLFAMLEADALLASVTQAVERLQNS